MKSPYRPSLALEVVRVCRRMYQKGLIASSEGNVSVALDEERLLTTPSGLPKGFLRPEQLVVVDREGHRLRGYLAPSSELRLHLLAYRERQDIGAVIHAHPTMAIACSLAGVSLAEGVIPEVVTTLGAIPTVSYATPGTAEAAEAIRGPIRHFDALILAHHGSVTVGKSLEEAYLKLEMLEHTAHILFMARLLGPVSPLPGQEVVRLLGAGGRDPSGVREVLPGLRAGFDRVGENGGMAFTSWGDSIVGALFHPWVVVLSFSEGPLFETAYQVRGKGDLRHILAGLLPQGCYRVTLDGRALDGSPFMASSGGILFFHSPGGGFFRVSLAAEK